MLRKKQNLDELIAKHEKIAGEIASLLEKQLDYDPEYSALTTLSILNACEDVPKYYPYTSRRNKLWETTISPRLKRNWQVVTNLTKIVGFVGGILGAIFLVAVVLYYGVTFLSVQFSGYPYVYAPKAEKFRFYDQRNDESFKELYKKCTSYYETSEHNRNRDKCRETDEYAALGQQIDLCVYEMTTTEVGDYFNDLNGNDLSQLPSYCLHPNKTNEVNIALQNSVDLDKSGIIWKGANGNGEIWTIERNNYRFVITAEADPNFKDN